MATLLHVVRVPVLIGLLLATKPAQERLFRAATRLELGAVWLPWAWIATLGVVFCVLALVGRGERQPRAVLAGEGIVAAVLALPSVLWGQWLGFGWLPNALGLATGSTFVSGLAVAWLVIVVLTGMRVLRVGWSAATDT